MFFYKYKESNNRAVHATLLWDQNLNDFDYQKSRTLVVQRVVERGRLEDWYAILNLYGIKGVKEAIKSIGYLNDIDSNFVRKQFNIPKKEMKCYNRQPWRVQHWNS